MVVMEIEVVVKLKTSWLNRFDLELVRAKNAQGISGVTGAIEAGNDEALIAYRSLLLLVPEGARHLLLKILVPEELELSASSGIWTLPVDRVSTKTIFKTLLEVIPIEQRNQKLLSMLKSVDYANNIKVFLQNDHVLRKEFHFERQQ